MASYNNVQFMGNLGAAPDLRHTDNGTAVATLNIAANRVWYDKNDKKHEETTWMRATVWAKQAENAAKYLKKGSGVFVSGRLVNSKYTDKEGVERYSTDISANVVQFLGHGEGGGGARPPHPAEGGGNSGGQRQRNSPRGGGPPDLPPPPASFDDDIPF